MRNVAWVLVTVGALGLVGCATTEEGRVTIPDADRQEVLAVNDEFYAALNTLFKGDSGPMEAMWSHADDVTYMGPMGGSLKGWPEVKRIWAQQAAMKLGGKVEPKHVTAVVGHGMALVTNIEWGENPHMASGPEKVDIRATNVYRWEDGAWKMIHHHTDLLPKLEAESASYE